MEQQSNNHIRVIDYDHTHPMFIYNAIQDMQKKDAQIRLLKIWFQM